MAGTASNEPYQRVSKDNGVFDGALIGAAIGAGGASAGVFGSAMNYNGIEKRAQRELATLEKQKPFYDKLENTALDRYANDVSAADRNGILKRRTMKKGQKAEDEIHQRQERRAGTVNQNRSNDISHLTGTVGRDFNSDVNPKDSWIRQKETEQSRSSAQERFHPALNDINSHYNTQIDAVNQRATHERQTNPDVQNRQKVIDARTSRANDRYEKSMGYVREHNDKMTKVSDPNYVKNQQNNHRYSKHMGGWKNAAIIGASTVLAGGVGMAADGLMN